MSNISTVAVDARTLTFKETGERGIGTFTIEHVCAWASSDPTIKFKLMTEAGAQLVRGEKLLQLPNIERAYYTLGMKEFSDVDLYHVPDPMSMIEGYDSPMRMAPAGIKTTMLFHDLILLALKKSVYDRWHSNIQRGYDVRLEHVRESGALLLANSQATKNDLINLAKLPTEKITVVSAGLSKSIPSSPTLEQCSQTKVQLGINKPFILVVGGLDEHKGFLYTLEACFELLSTEQMQLVIVGSMMDPWKLQLKDALARKNVKGVIFTGFVSDLQLSCLYNEALALSFPSEYEGFGFPVLEAMAGGCPVICSDRASLPEIAADAALYIKSMDNKGVFEAIRQLVANPGMREQMKQAGRERSKLFTWDAVAARTIEAIKTYNWS